MTNISHSSTDVEGEILRTAREVADEIALTAHHHDATASFPFDNFQVLQKAGLLSIPAPFNKGGAGAGLALSQKVVSLIASGEPSTALVLGMHYKNLASLAAGRRWPAAIADRLIAESVAGIALINSAHVEARLGSPSYWKTPETSASLVNGRWRLSGHKKYCTGVPILKWITVMARTNEQAPRVGTFLVPADAPGVSVVETWDAIGMRATASHDVIFEDVELPIENFFADNPAEKGPPPDDTMGLWHNTVITATYHGVGLAARRDLIAFAQGFVPPALGKPLADLPRIRDVLGQIDVLVISNERLLASVAQDGDRGSAGTLDALAVKHAVVDNVVTITRLALEIGGNQGLAQGHALQRHHRNALAGPAHAPQNALVRENLARRALA